ncbi:Teneurin-a [Diplonema papillatum]|nr:Teneurin-a [Diplonema papillatum]
MVLLRRLWVVFGVVGTGLAGDCLHSTVASLYGDSVVLREVAVDTDVPKQPFWIHPVVVGEAGYGCTAAGQVVRSPLTAVPVTCAGEDVLDYNQMAYVRDDFIPNAARIVGDTFLVAPTTPQLGLQDPLLRTKDAGASWSEGVPDSCGHVATSAVPEIKAALESIGGSTTVLPTRQPGFGVDMVLLVTFLPMPVEYSGTVSWSGVCVVDATTGLPRLAFMNVAPRGAKPATYAGRAALEKFLLHDLFHVMGFSPMYWNQTWGANRDPAATDGFTQFVARHTGCDDGSVSTALCLETAENPATHWKKRFFHTEILAPLSASVDVGPLVGAVSGMTLGYFQALNSGLGAPLGPNFTAVTAAREEALLWGAGRGCAWFRDCRDLAGNASFPEFCAPAAGGGGACDFFAFGKGACNAETVTIPFPLQPFDSQNLGSPLREMDYCPVVVPTTLCSDEQSTPTVANLEAFGHGSKCIASSTHGAVCLATCCAPRDTNTMPSTTPAGWRLYVDVPAAASGPAVRTVPCPSSGAPGTVSAGIWGDLACPGADVVCGAWAARDPSATAGAVRAFDFRPAVAAVGFSGVAAAVVLGFSVATDTRVNVSIAFPRGGYTNYDGPVTVTTSAPSTAGGAPATAWWEAGTLVITADFGVRPCDTVTWVVENFTTPAAPGDYGAYRIVVGSNDTSYGGTWINPVSDDILFYVTGTPTVSATASRTASLTKSATSSLSASPSITGTLSETITELPATATVTATLSLTATGVPYLPCYCFGRGVCAAIPGGNPVTNAEGIESRCLCDRGFTGRFCQIEICHLDAQCGAWGTCVSGAPNSTDTWPDYWRLGDPERRPHPWLLEVNAERPAPFIAPGSPWAPDTTAGMRDALRYRAGVDGLGWFHLCPDTPEMHNLTDVLGLSDVHGQTVLKGPPYFCTPARLSLTGEESVGEFVSKVVEVKVGGVARGFNVTFGWLTRGVFTVSVNISGAAEYVDLSGLPGLVGAGNATAGKAAAYEPIPFAGGNFTKVRLVFAADYASDDATSFDFVHMDVAFEADSRRLSFENAHKATFGGLTAATPVPRRLAVSSTRDASGRSPPVAHTLVPGSILEWLEQPLDRLPFASSRIGYQGDQEVVVGAPYSSQHLFVTFGGPPDPVVTGNYVAENLLTIRDYSCVCFSNASGLISHVDPSDPVCARCLPVEEGGPPAWPEGVCTERCGCDTGHCDAAGRCVCPPAFAGDSCEYCAAKWYPVPACDVFCEAGVTCLARGACNGYGRCVCRYGFTGDSCERMLCDDDALHCNGYGTCRAQQSPYRSLADLVQPGQLGNSSAWATAFPRRRDWDDEEAVWLDGGLDVFDGWGNFSVCTAAAGCQQLKGISHDGVKPVSVGLPGGTRVLVWVGWLNEAVFILSVDIDAGGPAWVEFGGKYGAPFQSSQNGQEYETSGGTATVAMRRVSVGAENSLGVLYGMARMRDNGRLNTTLTVTTPDAQSEKVTTPSLTPGDNSPITLFVHWGHLSGSFEVQTMRLAAHVAASMRTSWCENCGMRGGTWCHQCQSDRFPAPTLLNHPRGYTARPGNDTAACASVCECLTVSSADASAGGFGSCDARGACECPKGLAGDRCEACEADYYGWPACDVYCHALFTCSGKGVCGADGACSCFLGFRGFTCQLTACNEQSCSVGWNQGNATCASEASAFRSIWAIGTSDGSSAEFGRPFLRAGNQGPLVLNATCDWAEVPAYMGGPQLAEVFYGVDANEFNPFTVRFDLPALSADGYCQMATRAGSAHYPARPRERPGCVAAGGAWHPATLCFNRSAGNFTAGGGAAGCPEGTQEQVVFSEDSAFFFVFSVVRGGLADTVVEYSLNGARIATHDTPHLNTGVPLNFTDLRWGAPNEIEVKMTRGTTLAIDAVLLYLFTDSSNLPASMAGFYSSPKYAVEVNASKTGDFDPEFELEPGLLIDGPRGQSRFVTGSGVYTGAAGTGGAAGSARYVSVFANYGDFGMCLAEYRACTDLPVRAVTPATTVAFALGPGVFELRSEFANGVFTFEIKQTEAEPGAGFTPLAFNVAFGGNFSSSARERTTEVLRHQPVFSNYPSILSTVVTSVGPRDAFAFGEPQFHAGLVVTPGTLEEGADEGASPGLTVREWHHEVAFRTFVTEQRVTASNVEGRAVFVLQWGFKQYEDLVRYLFVVLSVDELSVCSCSGGFTGENCERCTSVDCDVEQCYDVVACGDCEYPKAGDSCTDCLAGYVGGGPSDTCHATCDVLDGCNDRGMCQLPNTCECYPGFYGNGCTLTAACLSECLGPAFEDCEKVSCFKAAVPGLNVQTALCPYGCSKGVCSRELRECVCEVGWSGVDCSTPTCEGGLTCYGHGYCAEPNTCVCQDGWVGSNCEASPCGALATCDGCAGAAGCGWCAATGECLPGHFSAGPFQPAPALNPRHPCAARPGLFKVAECWIGYAAGPPPQLGAQTVRYLNCTEACLAAPAADCAACLRLIPREATPGDFQPQVTARKLLESDGREFDSLQSVDTSTATMKAMPTDTPSATLTMAWDARSPTKTMMTSEDRCSSSWARYQWMPPSLVANYECACLLELSDGRDAEFACLEEQILTFFNDASVFTAALTDELNTRLASFRSSTRQLSQMDVCCDASDDCCDTVLLQEYQTAVQDYVEWYVSSVVPLHTAAYAKARATCACDASCANHQRDSLWRMMIQYTFPCVSGSPANILFYPCKPKTEQILESAVPAAPQEVPPCPLHHERVRVDLPFPAGFTEGSSAPPAYQTLTTCARWTLEVDWQCCDAALRCYADCDVEVRVCHSRFIACLADNLRCPALVGVRQLVQAPLEVSSALLYHRGLATFSAAFAVRKAACVCRAVSPPVPACANAVRFGGDCVCFEGWRKDAAGECTVATCPDDCNGRGRCAIGLHGTPACQCNVKWVGPACGAAVWAEATAFGLGHVLTAAGTLFPMHGHGAYQLLSAPSRDGRFSVQAQAVYLPSFGVSVLNAVSILLDQHKVDIWFKTAPETCIVAGPDQCGRGRLLATIDGEPIAQTEERYASAYKRVGSVVAYTAGGFWDTVVFVRMGDRVRAKVGAVWSTTLGRGLLNVVVAMKLPAFGDVAGMLGAGAVEHLWTDYHALGEGYRAENASHLPVYPAPDADSPGPPLPDNHRYYRGSEGVEDPGCRPLPAPFAAACGADAFLNESSTSVSEFFAGQRWCRGTPCFLNGYCVGPGACECPRELNGSAGCSLITSPGGNESEAVEHFAEESVGGDEYEDAVQDPAAGGKCASLEACSNHGACREFVVDGAVTGESCECSSNWTDPSCATPVCRGGCVHGICWVEPATDAPGCACHAGYAGPRCEVLAACEERRGCHGHGYCTAAGGCSCFSGWAGLECDREASGGVLCAAGMGGRWCTIPQCGCSGHGLCELDADEPRCACVPNWHAADCTVSCVAQITCSGHGVCNDQGLCDCTSPYRTQNCDVINPVVATSYILTFEGGTPELLQQGIDLQLSLYINGMTTIPADHTLRWSSSPSGLFSATTENSVSVTLDGSLFQCDSDTEYISAIVVGCRYTITAKLSTGIVDVASTSVTVKIRQAPKYDSGAAVSAPCDDETAAVCRFDELAAEVTIDAGLWVTDSPPMLYKFTYDAGGVSDMPVGVNGRLGYQTNPVVSVAAPPAACSTTSEDSAVEFKVHVQDQTGAISTHVLGGGTPDLALRRLSDAAALAYLDGMRADRQNSTAADVFVAVTSLCRRVKAGAWPWPLLRAATDGVLASVAAAGYPSEIRLFAAAALADLAAQAGEVSSEPACALSNATASAGFASLSDAERAERLAYLEAAAKDVVLAETRAAELSADKAASLFDSIAKLPGTDLRVSLYEAALLRVSEDLSLPTATVATYPSVLPATNYFVAKTTVFTYDRVSAPAGTDLVMASIDPGTDRSFVVPGESGSMSVTLESQLVSVQARDPATKMHVPIVVVGNQSEPVALLVFTLSRDIDHQQSYACIFWETTWRWGTWVGVGPLAAAPGFDSRAVPAGNVRTSYACNVSHFTMYALAYVEPVVAQPPQAVDNATAPAEPEVYLPPESDIYLASEDSTANIGEVGLIVGCVVGGVAVLLFAYLIYDCAASKGRKVAFADKLDDPAFARRWMMRTRKKKPAADAVAPVRRVYETGRSGGGMKLDDIRASRPVKGGLPEPPADAVDDEYLAQRDMEMIERIVNVEDLSVFDPAYPSGTSQYAYPIEGDSEDEGSVSHGVGESETSSRLDAPKTSCGSSQARTPMSPNTRKRYTEKRRLHRPPVRTVRAGAAPESVLVQYSPKLAQHRINFEDREPE